MTMMNAPADTAYREALDGIVARTIAPMAGEVDETAAFPRQAMTELAQAGILGLISAPDVGGMGLGPGAAVGVIEKIAQHCASTAMVVCMHYAGTAVIEAHGDLASREAAATGRATATLAFSEAGSRSHFWAPVSSAQLDDGMVRLDGQKSWVTSAGEADLYVWSSRPLAGEGASTIWLVDADTAGLRVAGAFDGLGLRGNCSSPIIAEEARVATGRMLGADGGGFDVMMAVVLPYFQLMNAAFSVGTMEAATTKAAAHAGGARFAHLDQTLADLPTIRAYVARMRIKTDMARALLMDAVSAAETGREDAMLRVLESKAAAGEASTEVTDLAMRVCGGAAFRKEVGIERHFRDARAATVMAPTTDVLYDFIGRAACGLPLF